EVPCLLNTSFNVAGEPIVCSPRDALECFLATEIDYLVIDRFVITKKEG
ncbi:carbamoyltransferase C-terminal domain-containing protein, partial [Streptomyces sp. 2MCAF27]